MRNIAFATTLLIFLTAPCMAADPSTVTGVYFCNRDETQFLTLRPDSSFVLRQRKKPPDKDNPFTEYSGKYVINGETLRLVLDDGREAEGQLKGNVFTDGQGVSWQKKSTEQPDVVRPKYKPWYR